MLRYYKSSNLYILFDDNNEVAYCEFCINTDKTNQIYIKSVYVHENFRNLGYGSTILYELLMDMYHNKNILYALLDDCTDRYKQSNNIYIHMGFNYVSIYGDNSMIANLRHILYGKRSYRIKKIRK